MTVHPVSARAAGGPIAARVEAVQYPQSIAGGVFRYAQDNVDSELVGSFRTELPEVPLGTVADNADRVFLVSGSVIHMSDPTPTAYLVRLTVEQDGNVLYQDVPESNGRGTIKDQDVPFMHLFQIKAA